MKRTALTILSALILFSASACSSHENTLKGTVTAINQDYINISTEDGNGWIIDYKNGYTIDQNIIITFDDMGTSEIYDDEIINIK